jgi:hypothetical protein
MRMGIIQSDEKLTKKKNREEGAAMRKNGAECDRAYSRI